MNDLTPFEKFEINNPPLATAELLDTSKLAELLAYTPNGLFFGCAVDGRLLSSPKGDDTHSIVCGGTRADKGTFCSNILLTRTSSAYISTTKPQDVNKLAPRRGKGNALCDGMGQRTVCWAGHGNVECDEVELISINPLDRSFIDPDSPDCISRMMRLAICVVPLKPGGANDYFANDCRLLLLAVMLYVCIDPIFEGRRHLGTVYDLLVQGDVETWEIFKQQGILETDKHGNITQTPQDLMWAAMEVTESQGDVVAKRARYFRNLMTTGDGGQWIGVLGEVTSSLGFLDDTRMRAALSESTFDMATLKTDPAGVTFFEILEASKAKVAMPARRMIWSIFEETMKTTQGKPATGQSVLVWADEFHSWGYMDSILGNLAELAGYFVKMVFLTQTLSQIADEKEGYGKHGLQVFYSGCICRIFLDVRDLFTAQEIQRMAGEKEVLIINRSASQAKAKGKTEATNYSDSEGSGRGTHRSGSKSQGGSKQHSYNGSIFSPFTPLMLKKLWNTSLGGNWTSSETEGENESTNKSHTEGGSTSDTETNTETGTLTEQPQVRPLLPVNEIMNNYGKLRPDGKRMALIHVCGIGWFETYRVRHWEHEIFYRCYGSDGDHEFVQAPKPRRAIEKEQRQAIAAEQEQRRLAEIEYDNSPVGQAANCKELQELKEQDDLSLTAVGLRWVSGAAFLVFLGLGTLLPAIAAGGGFFAAGKWKKAIADRSNRIHELKSRIGNARSQGLKQ